MKFSVTISEAVSGANDSLGYIWMNIQRDLQRKCIAISLEGQVWIIRIRAGGTSYADWEGG